MQFGGGGNISCTTNIFPFLVPFFVVFLAIKLYVVVWFNISDSPTQ